ncbi:MAG: acyl carrier protein [Eubacterium sp.]|nr:acyl carrier protein [Eubacterium sp.]
MGKDEVRAGLKELISEVMPELDDIDMDKDIVSEYGVNSISIIRLIVSAEKKFDISFTDYELSLAEYPTFNDLATVIISKLDKN